MIESALDQSITKLIKLANDLGQLPTSSLLALMCLWLGWDKYKRDDKTQEIRTAQAIAEGKNADALMKLADGYEELVITVRERLPHK